MGILVSKHVTSSVTPIRWSLRIWHG